MGSGPFGGVIMFYCGIDWSKDHHNLGIKSAAGSRVSQIEFKHTLKGFEQIEVERRKLNVPASECLVAIETTYNLLVDFLLEHNYVVYIVPPQATNAYRNRQRGSGAHTDESDAALLGLAGLK
jgi:transposase